MVALVRHDQLVIRSKTVAVIRITGIAKVRFAFELCVGVAQCLLDMTEHTKQRVRVQIFRVDCLVVRRVRHVRELVFLSVQLVDGKGVIQQDFFYVVTGIQGTELIGFYGYPHPVEVPDDFLPFPVPDGPIILKDDDNIIGHLEPARIVRNSLVRERRLVCHPLGVLVETLDELHGMLDQIACPMTLP